MPTTSDMISKRGDIWVGYGNGGIGIVNSTGQNVGSGALGNYEVREGKNKRAVGFRRVACENTDDTIEALNQTHDERQSSNPLARANPQAKQHGNEQRDATRA